MIHKVKAPFFYVFVCVSVSLVFLPSPYRVFVPLNCSFVAWKTEQWAVSVYLFKVLSAEEGTMSMQLKNTTTTKRV